MTVNNVNALLTYVSGRADAVGSMADESMKEDFGQLMARLNGRTDGPQTELPNSSFSSAQNVVPVSTAQKDVSVSNTDAQDQAGQTENASRKDSDESITQDTRANAETDTADKVSEELEKSGEELVQDVADEMGVTKEEVEEAMALLGLTAVQLFDPDNLKQLLLTISGNTDELSLLTDEALYGSLRDLLGIVEESLENLQKELGLSEEEFDAFMKQMLSDQADPDSADEAPIQDVNLEGMKDYTVSVQKDGETVQMKVIVDDVSGDRSVQESVTGTARTETPNGQKMMQERDASANSGREGNAAGNALLQTLEPTLEADETPEAAHVEYRSLQTEEIMNQIMDYMKINLKADTQSMELQLHPASLGTLNVQIVAKDGGVTAHFTTQNEAVRAVVETQLIQLKNQFEEQGIKVDAVEVTVANHAYGQQFSQNSENAEQDQAKAGKGRRRSINLDQIGDEEDLEEMEDSERIAVEMMQANGNTVDYTA